MTFLEKIQQLPSPISTFFLSDSQRHELEKGCYIYGVDDDDDIGKIALKLGQLYIGELKLKDLPFAINKETNLSQKVCYGLSFEINRRIFNRFPEYYTDSSGLLVQWDPLKSAPLISEDAAWKKVLEAEPWILENEKEEQKEKAAAQKKIDNIKIDEALKKYPNLGEQSVTGNPLKLRYFPTPVRPSIKNWITDFHDNMGAGKHGSIDRGNYLFHSDNGKKLTPVERQKLSELFKSLDEQTPLQIDIESQTVVFGGSEEKTSSGSMNRSQAGESQDIFQRYVSRPQPQQARPYSPPNFAAKPAPQTNAQARTQTASDNYFGNFASSQTPPSSVRSTGHLLPEREKGTMKKSLNSPNFAASGGIVSFSSSQKLPVEQNASAVKITPRPTEPQKPQPQTPRPQPQQPSRPQPQPQAEKISHPDLQSIRQAQWHIAPSGYNYEDGNGGKKDVQPKTDKNIVDLRN